VPGARRACCLLAEGPAGAACAYGSADAPRLGSRGPDLEQEDAFELDAVAWAERAGGLSSGGLRVTAGPEAPLAARSAELGALDIALAARSSGGCTSC
jgi:hypothetical protein